MNLSHNLSTFLSVSLCFPRPSSLRAASPRPLCSGVCPARHGACSPTSPRPRPRSCLWPAACWAWRASMAAAPAAGHSTTGADSSTTSPVSDRVWMEMANGKYDSCVFVCLFVCGSLMLWFFWLVPHHTEGNRNYLTWWNRNKIMSDYSWNWKSQLKWGYFSSLDLPLTRQASACLVLQVNFIYLQQLVWE